MEGKGSDWRPGPTVCRCCLTEGCYKDISTEYFWMGKREVYSEMLAETLNVSIAYSKSGGPNSNSRLICEPCISRLRDASEFKRQVIDCEKTFMHHLDPGSSSKLREVETIGEVKVELVKREKETNSDDDFDDRPDFLDVDTDDDLDDQPLTKLASKIPKKEAVDILELLDSSQITVKRKSNLKLKAPPKKIVKKKEVVPKPSASKPAAAKQAEKKKEPNLATYSRRNVSAIIQFSTANPFRLPGSEIMCVYCSDSFTEATLFRQHMDDEHKEFNPEHAFTHLSKGYLKMDITNLCCRICTLPFRELQKLAEHLVEIHSKNLDLNTDLEIQPFRLENGQFICPICENKASSICSLNRHVQKHFLLYKCKNCGKAYSAKSSLVYHEKYSCSKGTIPPE